MTEQKTIEDQKEFLIKKLQELDHILASIDNFDTRKNYIKAQAIYQYMLESLKDEKEDKITIN